jgi:hypothetical protein
VDAETGDVGSMGKLTVKVLGPLWLRRERQSELERKREKT